MIVACGEALIDFVPARSTAGAIAYVPRPGGSPFNVAVTIGRLGLDSAFLGGVSHDFFGTQLVDALRHSGVDTRFVARVDRPSGLAFVNLASPEPHYTFYDRDAAHRAAPALPAFDAAVTALHFGSISLIDEPAAAAYRALMQREHGRRIISLDPNVRPSLVGVNEAAYRARLGAMLALAGVVKISAADLAWLEPHRAHASVAAAWLDAGAALAVVTAGADGATAYLPGGRTVACAAARQATLVDTVGAGDSFMGALLAGLEVCGVTSPASLAGVDETTVAEVLRFATGVAAITCSRAGADPPWRDEVTLPEPAGRAKGRP